MSSSTQSQDLRIPNWVGDSDLASLVEEQRRANALLAKAGKKVPEPGAVEPKKMRYMRRFDHEGKPRIPSAESAYDQMLVTKNGEVRTRVFPAKHSQGLYIHFHGGGLVLGSIYEQDLILEELAERTDLTVVSIEYPLAPESNHAQAIESAQISVLTLISQSSERQVFVGGESAGAHVALHSVIGLRDHPEQFAKIRAINLCYGLYDLSMTPSQRLSGADFIGLSKPYLEWFYALSLPGITAEQRRDPSVSPLYANLDNLPSALFTVGSLDPLLDDTLFMASRWRASGNAAQLEVYPEAHHGFNGTATTMATLCNRNIHQFLIDHISA